MPTKTQSVPRPRQRATRDSAESRNNKKTGTHQLDGNSLDLRARILERAYALYEENGRVDGHALEHWLEAERQVFNQGL
jgi:DUF2934 family protein